TFADGFAREPVAHESCGRRRYASKSDAFEVASLLCYKVAAAGGRKPGDLLAEGIVAESDCSGRRVLLGFVNRVCERSSRDEHKGEQYPGRATSEKTENLLKAKVCLLRLHQSAFLVSSFARTSLRRGSSDGSQQTATG